MSILLTQVVNIIYFIAGVNGRCIKNISIAFFTVIPTVFLKGFFHMREYLLNDVGKKHAFHSFITKLLKKELDNR